MDNACQFACAGTCLGTSGTHILAELMHTMLNVPSGCQQGSNEHKDIQPQAMTSLFSRCRCSSVEIRPTLPIPAVLDLVMSKSHAKKMAVLHLFGGLAIEEFVRRPHEHRLSEYAALLA